MVNRKKKYLIVLSSFLVVLIATLIGLFVYEYIRIKPNDVKFTNVTSTSVTVSWNTDTPLAGTVRVFEGEIKTPVSFFGGEERFFDTRDVKKAELEAAEETSRNIIDNQDLTVSSSDFVTDVEVMYRGDYYTHHVSITGLSPETEYSFMVGDTHILRKVIDFEGNSTVRTFSIPENVKSPSPAYGSVKDAQNKGDVEFEDLPPLDDGLLYFNYLDEFSGERSNVFSSSLNDGGGWYIDVGGAVGEDGEPFLDRFEDTVTNILVELSLDAGPLGKWETIENFDAIAPTETIILNVPNVSNEKLLPLEKLDSNNMIENFFDKSIQGVSAQSKNCQWISFCSLGWYDYSKSAWVTCSNSEITSAQASTLESRGCSGISNAQAEIANYGNCGGGVAENAYACSNSDQCVQCQRRASDNQLRLVNVASSYCAGKACGSSSPQTQTCWTISSEGGLPYCSSYQAATCDSGDYSSKSACEDIVNQNTPDTRTCYRVQNGRCVSYQDTDQSCGNNYTTNTGCLNANDPCSGKDAGDFCIMTNGSTGMCSSSGICRTSIAAPCQGGAASEGSNCIVEGNAGNCNASGVCVPKNTTVGVSEEEDSETVSCKPNITFMKPCITLEGEAGKCSMAGACFKSGADCIFDGEENRLGEYNSMGTCTASFIGTTIEQAIPFRVGGQVCNTTYPCFCKSSDKVLPYLIAGGGTWCPHVRKDNACNENRNGWVCKASQDKYICDGDDCVPSGSVQGIQIESNNQNSFVESFISKAEAYDYIFDTGTGIISSISEGTYIFEYEGESYAFIVPEGADEILIFIDENDNGVYDENIDTLLTDLATVVSVVSIEQTYTYQLETGLNFVSLPFIIPEEGLQTAAGLLKEMNDLYPDSIYSISKFTGSWKMVGQNVEVYDNNDFQLLPGQGYVIKAQRDVEIDIVGQPIQFDSEDDNAPITLNEGWNLVGLYGTSVKAYTAKSLLENINTDDFTADNVTKWAKDRQAYEGLQITNGQEYGFDYPINKLESYFVRITEGSGNWQPELADSN